MVDDDRAFVAPGTEAHEFLEYARALWHRVEDWIAQAHPAFLPLGTCTEGHTLASG